MDFGNTVDEVINSALVTMEYFRVNVKFKLWLEG